MTIDKLVLPSLAPARPWTTPRPTPDVNDVTFVVLSDRTAIARPGVFERAVEITNALRPDFVIQVGDQIEGYTDDQHVLDAQWAEFDEITDQLSAPLFRVPGNHDVSNELMRADWLRRYGALHYSFRSGDALFVVLDTQDPPQTAEDFGANEESSARAAELFALSTPDLIERIIAAGGAGRLFTPDLDWERENTANIGEQQADWACATIDENSDAAWTFLLMHMPAWRSVGGTTNANFERIVAALGERPFTALAGHVHNYQRRVLDGRDHIRLGPTGGIWNLDTPDGNFDHVMLVNVRAGRPTISNVLLDGVLGPEGGPSRVVLGEAAPV